MMDLEKYELKQDMLLGFEERGGGEKLPKVEERELLMSCDCYGEIVRLTNYSDEEEVYLTIYKYHFEGQSFLTRLKGAWNVFRGRGISTADVVLSKENFNKIKQF